MIPAANIQPQAVEVVVGIDAAQLEAAYALHRRYAAEMGVAFDGDGWATEVRDAIAAGAYNVGVAWDGGEPVGVVEMWLEYDPMTSRRYAWGRRAYVIPDYRSEGVFRAIFDFGEHGARFLGLDGCRAHAESDWYGQVMKRFYESEGFRPIATVMEKSWHS